MIIYSLCLGYYILYIFNQNIHNALFTLFCFSFESASLYPFHFLFTYLCNEYLFIYFIKSFILLRTRYLKSSCESLSFFSYIYIHIFWSTNDRWFRSWVQCKTCLFVVGQDEKRNVVQSQCLEMKTFDDESISFFGNRCWSKCVGQPELNLGIIKYRDLSIQSNWNLSKAWIK